MTDRRHFKAELVEDDKTTATSIKIPFDVKAEWDRKGRVPVRATLNGFPIRSSIFAYSGIHYLIVNKQMREGAGLRAGDLVDVVMEVDTEPRSVQVPEDLQAALQTNQAARTYWEKLSYTHQREYVGYIDEAKKPVTRVRRIEKTLQMLAASQREPR
jgi:hypothetical protein